MKAFVFPGQGSQKVGMGGPLFDEVPEFRALEPQIDALLGYSLRTLCLHDPDQRLQQTECTQPALYVVNALHHYAALARGTQPAMVAGHSLGEYNALLAAGAFDFLTGLKLVQRRGALMSQARNGGMAAVIGISGDQVSDLLAEHGLASIDAANFNSRTQTVISGPLDAIRQAAPIYERAGASFIPLPVSAAFHSRYMQDAAAEFERFLAGFEFQQLRLPVISNVTARPYGRVNPSATVRSLLVRQITSPVQWTQSVLYLLDRGVAEFEELGPGNVLTRLVRQIEAPPAAVAA